MQPFFFSGLSSLPLITGAKSRAVTAENPNGEKSSGGKTASHLGPGRKGSPCLRNIAAGSTVTLMDVDGPGIIQHIWMTVTNKTSEANRYVLRDLVLRIYWNDEKSPSVESPLGDFFCNGFGQDCIVNSLPVVVNPTRGFNCFFAMPFAKHVKVTLENQHPAPIPDFFYEFDYCLTDSLPDNIGYFHAQWRRKKITALQEDYVILDGVNGAGQYVGTYLALSTLERGWWGEGEIKFYLDGDKEYPTICGTGTEDYFGGAWSFATQLNGCTIENTFCTPFMGYPFYSAHDNAIHSDYHNDECPPMRGLYRFHIPDPIHFSKDLKVTLQQIGGRHGGNFERQDDVSTVAYWYQNEPHTPFAPLPSVLDRHPR